MRSEMLIANMDVFLNEFAVICNNQQLGARRGGIVTPEYPKVYPKNAKCDWTIAVDKGYQITLHFSKVQVLRPLRSSLTITFRSILLENVFW